MTLRAGVVSVLLFALLLYLTGTLLSRLHLLRD